MLINDDMGFITEILRQTGTVAAETERKVVWDDLIFANPAGYFSTDNGNTASAAAGSTVSATTLNLARTALRAQIAPDGTEVGARLAYVVAGPATETAWEALLAGRWLPAAASEETTAELKNVRVLIEPKITDESWYGFADWRLGTTALEYAFLGEGDGLRVEQRRGWETDTLEIKTALDVGAGLLDFRGSFRLSQA
jgi:hypothetical protein